MADLASTPSACERCIKCGTTIPYGQGVVIGLCVECWNRAVEEVAAESVNDCERCEGEGSYSDFADCTTFGPDCACNGPRVVVNPCPVCGGSGRKQEGPTHV